MTDGPCIAPPHGQGLRAVELTTREREILDFERVWWSEPGPKDEAIKNRFELSTTRYYEILGELLDNEAAYDYDPLVVRRLRRLRARRRRARLGGPEAMEPNRR